MTREEQRPRHCVGTVPLLALVSLLEVPELAVLLPTAEGQGQEWVGPG